MRSYMERLLNVILPALKRYSVHPYGHVGVPC